jgi:hypothetical protein
MQYYSTENDNVLITNRCIEAPCCAVFQIVFITNVTNFVQISMRQLSTTCFGLSAIIRYVYSLLAALLSPYIGSLYGRYNLCCRFDILGCDATIYVIDKMLNLKIKFLKFVEF